MLSIGAGGRRGRARKCACEEVSSASRDNDVGGEGDAPVVASPAVRELGEDGGGYGLRVRGSV